MASELTHDFPRARLEKQGVQDLKLIKQVANNALLEWPENIQICDAAPSEYVPKICERFSSDEWNRMHRLHGLPMHWEQMEYADFLDERRKLMAAIIREGFETLK